MIGLGNSVVKRKLGGGPPAAPVNVSQPFLVGTGEVGTVVTCNRGSWSGSPTPTYTYDFRLDSVSVQNGSSNSYTPLLADDGKTLTCLVTATNSQGSASEGTSNSIVIGIAPSNTIAPTLSPSGTQITGTVITASVGTWTGTPTITYEYRWTRNGSPITGATSSTYTIQAADDGTTIRCEVRGTNAYGVSSYVASSNSVSAVNAVAPVNTVAPVISGSTTLGSTLTSTTGTWTGTPTPTYSYQWKRNGSNIGGAINSTYVTTLADSSANITCDVTATNTAGSATAGSNTITLPSYAPVNTVAPVISGNQWQGQVLTTTNGTWTNSPSFTYQWRRGGVDIGGATSSTYTLVAADRGTNITCVVTASNGVSPNGTATSNTLAIYNTVVQESGSSAAASFDINVLTNSTYANATTQIVRVRRSGDNAEADYGVQADGTVNWTAITSWVVAGGGTQDGFIVTVYDQSGNARNFTQSTPSLQPQIIASGVLQTFTGAGSGAVARAEMRPQGSRYLEIPSSTALFNFLHNGGDGWILSVHRFGDNSNPNAVYGICGNAAFASANIGMALAFDDRAGSSRNNGLSQIVYRGTVGTLSSSNLSDNVITPNNTVIINNYFDADNATAANRLNAWVNNGSLIANNTLTNTVSASNASFNMQWGALGNNSTILTGGMQRLIIWNANLSATRSAITTLTNNYYRAY